LDIGRWQEGARIDIAIRRQAPGVTLLKNYS